MADEAAYLGPAPASESYLRIDKIVDAARQHGADAIHPGYGFLSENAEFAEACEAAGIVFIGPPAAAIRQMGSKTAARKLAIAAGAPVVPGTESAIDNLANAKRYGAQTGLSGAAQSLGGRRRQRHAARRSRSDLEAALRDASSEALRAFRNGEVYLEKLAAGAAPHRDSSAGRPPRPPDSLGGTRMFHPAAAPEGDRGVPFPGDDRISGIARATWARPRCASRAPQTICNAGTMEFLVDRDRNFYFLEMNTRLQVEHPVTELVTGLDLVQWQLRIAAGEASDRSAGRRALVRLGHRVPHLRRRSRPTVSAFAGTNHAADGARGARRAARFRSL